MRQGLTFGIIVVSCFFLSLIHEPRIASLDMCTGKSLLDGHARSTVSSYTLIYISNSFRRVSYKIASSMSPQRSRWKKFNSCRCRYVVPVRSPVLEAAGAIVPRELLLSKRILKCKPHLTLGTTTWCQRGMFERVPCSRRRMDSEMNRTHRGPKPRRSIPSLTRWKSIRVTAGGCSGSGICKCFVPVCVKPLIGKPSGGWPSASRASLTRTMIATTVGTEALIPSVNWMVTFHTIA